MSLTSASGSDLSLLYIGYFNRLPDPAGFAFWEEVLRNGLDLEKVAVDFSTQAEASEIFGPLANPQSGTIADFLNTVYQNLFNRMPDGPGVAFWGDYIADGGQVGDVVLSIIRGAAAPDQEVLEAKLAVASQWSEGIEQDSGFVFSDLAVRASRNALDQAGTEEMSQAEALDDAALFFQDAPAITYTPTRTGLAESADTTNPIKIGDLEVFEAFETTSAVHIIGPDAGHFEIIEGEVFLKSGVFLDFETAPLLSATIEVDDPLFGGTPDDDAAIAINVRDVVEAPQIPPEPPVNLAPVAGDIDLGTVADVNAVLHVSDANLIDGFGTDRDSNLDADDILLVSATIDGMDVNFADIGFTLTPGVRDAGAFTIDTRAIAYDALTLGETADIVVTFDISDGELSDTGTLAFTVESITNDLGGAFDLDDDGFSRNDLDFVGNVPNSQMVMADATAAADEYVQSTTVAGDIGFVDFFGAASAIPDGFADPGGAPMPTGAVALDFAMLPAAMALDLDALDGISIATALAADDATAMSSVMGSGVAAAVALSGGVATGAATGQSFAVAQAEDAGSDATSNASDMSIARAISATQGAATTNADNASMASSTATNGSSATATAVRVSEASAGASDGGQASGTAADDSTATATAETGGIADAVSVNNAEATATAFAGADATAFAEDTSTAAATADNGGSATSSADFSAQATSFADNNSTAVAGGSQDSSAQAAANNSSIATSDAKVDSEASAVADGGSAASAVASDMSDAGALAENGSVATSTATNTSSATTTADNASIASATADDNSVSVATSDDGSSATAFSGESSAANANALNTGDTNAVALRGSASSANASNTSDATALGTNGSAAEATADDTSSASAQAGATSNATATATAGSTTTAHAEDMSSATAAASDGSVANAIAATEGIANAIAALMSAAFASAETVSDSVSQANMGSASSATATTGGDANASASDQELVIVTSTGPGLEDVTQDQGAGVPDMLIMDITDIVTVNKAQIADAAMNAITGYVSSIVSFESDAADVSGTSVRALHVEAPDAGSDVDGMAQAEVPADDLLSLVSDGRAFALNGVAANEVPLDMFDGSVLSFLALLDSGLGFEADALSEDSSASLVGLMTLDNLFDWV